jgi:hypothetical protein
MNIVRQTTAGQYSMGNGTICLLLTSTYKLITLAVRIRRGETMKRKLIALLTILLVVVSGCNLPSGTATQSPDAAYTAAAQTVDVELTKLAPPPTALATPTEAVPPTPIPIPTNTTIPVSPSPTALSIPCNRAAFVSDVSVPDGTAITPGASFTKTWRLSNTGTCTWTSGYQLVFHTGDAMGVPAGYAQALTSGTVPPGGTVDITVTLIAPTAAGAYKGYWRLREPGGEYFGLNNSNSDFWVSISTSTAAIFAVTSVKFTVSGTCGAFHIIANITTNGAGKVTYKWVRSDGAADTASHAPLVFTSAGTQAVSTDWSVSASGAHWIDLYIDAPNHQQFQRAKLNCP